MLKRFILTLLFLMPCSAWATCADPYGSSGYFGCTLVNGNEQKLFAAGGIDLHGQANVTHYGPNFNAEAGAWFHIFPVMDSTATWTIALPQAVSAGVALRIFFEGYDLDSAMAGSGAAGGNLLTEGKTISYTIGGTTSSSVTLCDRDKDGLWTPAATVTPAGSSSTLQVNLTRNANGDPNYQRTIPIGIWITTETSVTVNRTSFLANLTLPSTTDDNYTTSNYITNGSFENPADGAWMWYPARKDVPRDLRQASCTGGAHTGSACLAIPLAATNFFDHTVDIQLASHVFHVIPNRKYTFSVYAKAASGTLGVGVNCRNVYVPPTGYDAQVIITGSGTATTSWTRIKATGYLKEYPTADYLCTVTWNGAPASNTLYLDDLQLEEGPDATTYQASHALDVVLSSSHAGNIYYTTDTQQATVNLYNSSNAEVSRTLKYEIYDSLTLRQITSGSTGVTVAANTQTTTTLTINPDNLKGDFLVLYWLDTVLGSQKEFKFSNVTACAAGVDLTSYLGAHPNFQPSTLDSMARLCYKWARSMSPGGQARWELVEPTEGVFDWDDQDISAAISRDIIPLMSIHSNNYGTPTYGYSGGVPIAAKLQTFAETVVAHYSALGAHYYEAWNEPEAHMSASAYAEVLYTISNAVHSQDASGKVVGFGGSTATFIASTITALGISHPTFNPYTQLEAFSTHIYCGGDTTALSAYVGLIPVDNTESGCKDEGSYLGEYSSFTVPGKPFLDFQIYNRYQKAAVKVPIDYVTTYAQGVANGLRRYYAYDTRNVEPYTFDLAFTGLSKDSMPKAKMVALGIANGLINHSTGTGNASGSAGSIFLVFDRGVSDPIALLYASTHTRHQVIVQNSITHGQLQALDVSGNAFTITGTTVPYGRMPVWLVGVGISAATLKTGLSSGTVTTISDTVAPNILFADAPRGNLVAGSAVRLRAVCVDETSYSNAGEFGLDNFGVATEQLDPPNPEATQFAYKIGTGAWSDWGQTSLLDYAAGVLDGSYTFSFKCRDTAGNESATVTRDFVVGTATPPAGKKLRLRR